ncbi:hypothetical protein [Amycolatopsis sp. NPDC051903]|uniref:hypothetical protein n=1 Tax=Amycolatopsis sp. NPDC051903 TaxID=3363936 RepID=UPI00378E4A88
MKRAAVAGLALLAAGCSSTVVAPPAPPNPPQPANLAFVDTPATTAATTGIKQAVETAFTYDSTDQGAVAKTEQEYLAGAARTQFDQTFAQVKTTPVKTKTQVLSTGVADLQPRSAKVLVVASQQSSTPDGKTNAATALMLVTAVPASGHWQLTDLNFDPRGALAPDAPAASGAATTRDSALAAAHQDGAILLTLDAQNADAVYDRYESVAADPLLGQFRTTRAHTVDNMKASGAKTSLDPQSVAALTSATPDGKQATVLLGAIVSTQQKGGTQDRRLNVQLTLVRQGAGWKVSGIESLGATQS